MQLRNTPDLDCDISPSVIVFGRPIRDAFAFLNRLDKFSNDNVRPIWREAWNKKEDALRERFHKTAERLNKHARQLPLLDVGDRCYLQNQTGNFVEQFGHDSYAVKIDGTGRITRRNRRFLKKFVPVTHNIQHSSPHHRYTHRAGQPTSLALTPRNSFVQPHTVDTLPEAQSVPTQRTLSNDTSFEAPHVMGCQPDDLTPSTTPPAEYTVPQPMNIATELPDAPEGSPLSPTTRPRRQRRAPSRYEPESGKWIGTGDAS